MVVSICAASERPADALPNGTRAIELHQFVADAAGAPYSRAEHSGGKTWHLVTVLFEMNFATYEWRKVRLVDILLRVFALCAREAQLFILAGSACF